jgi:hypothetical protein
VYGRDLQEVRLAWCCYFVSNDHLQRAVMLIEIAHPDDRAALWKWGKRNLCPNSNKQNSHEQCSSRAISKICPLETVKRTVILILLKVQLREGYIYVNY